MRAGLMMMGKSIHSAAIVEVIDYTTSWRPDTGAAQIGDLAIALCQNVGGSGWTNATNFRYRFLTIADLSTNFDAVSGRGYAVVVLRYVRSLTQKISATATNGTNVGSFTKADGHCGVLIATEIDPNSIRATPAVSVGGVNVPQTARYYSAPADGDSTRNLHCYLQPSYVPYVSGASFVAGSDAGWPTDVRVFELLGD